MANSPAAMLKAVTNCNQMKGWKHDDKEMYRESFLVAVLTYSSYAISPVHDSAEADGFALISTWECVTEHPPMVLYF
jgi:hypothetical protein